MKKVDQSRRREDFISMEEIAVLIERAEARALKEAGLSACNAQAGGQIITEAIRKTMMIEQLAKEGKITSRGQLRRLMAIPRPQKAEEKKSDE